MRKIFLVLTVLLAGCSSGKEEEINLAMVGKKAPEIKVSALTERNGEWKIPGEKPQVVTFFSTWQKDIGKVLTVIVDLESDFGGDAEFVLLSDEKPKDILKCLRARKISKVKAGSVKPAAFKNYRVYSRGETVLISSGIVRGFIRIEDLTGKVVREFINGGEMPDAPFLKKDGISY